MGSKVNIPISITLVPSGRGSSTYGVPSMFVTEPVASSRMRVTTVLGVSTAEVVDGGNPPPLFGAREVCDVVGGCGAETRVGTGD